MPFDRSCTVFELFDGGLEIWVRSLKMVPCIVTVAVSVAVSEIFSVKMARFDRPCTTFYLSAIVTIALFVPFSSYLMLNNTVTLKLRLKVTRGH